MDLGKPWASHLQGKEGSLAQSYAVPYPVTVAATSWLFYKKMSNIFL